MRHSKAFHFISCLVVFFIRCSPARATEDKTGLFVSILTDNPPGASGVLADPTGRRTGIISVDQNGEPTNWVHEIPDSNAAFEASPGDDMTGTPAPTGHVDISLNQNVSSGVYRMSVFSLGGTTLPVVYELLINPRDSGGKVPVECAQIKGAMFPGQNQEFQFYYSAEPGSVILLHKQVTFAGLLQNLSVAQRLSQLGNDKFVLSLVKQVNLAEKLSAMCDKRKKHGKDEACKPAIAVLKLFIKRLEIANRKCAVKSPRECDEDKDWAAFRKEHRKDHDYDDFFREWDRDDWHKHKKTCKRFITDEALKIIKDDAGWLIKSLGGEADKEREGHDGHDKDKSHD